MVMLTDDVVQLWLVADETIEDEALLAKYYRWLGPDERTRYQRIACARQRRQYLVTRALVRDVLSYYVPEVGLRTWIFNSNDYGKPAIVYPHLPLNFRFNLSHTKGLIVLAVCIGAEIGIDVEWLYKTGFSMALAEHYFSSVEVKALKALPKSKQWLRVFDLWVLKEAYVKARGLGFNIALNSFAYTFIGGDRLKMTFSETLEDDSARWRLWLFCLRQEYRLALALMVDPDRSLQRVEVNEFIPGGRAKSVTLLSLRTLNVNEKFI